MVAPVVPIAILPQETLDGLTRITALLDRAEPRVRKRFVRLVQAADQVGDLETIAGFLESGRINEALAYSEQIGDGLATSLEGAYAAAGLSAAEVLRSQIDTLFEFNTMGARSVASLQETRLRLVREFTREQRLATRTMLSSAITRGLPPIEQARILKQSIGLTRYQANAVNNFERLISEGSPASIRQALNRKLRDGRFDRTLGAVARGERTLTPAQIERMTTRYRERFIQYRANVIARTETVAAVHAGDLEMWTQAIDAGEILPQDVEQTWRTFRDENRRQSHARMEGQVQDWGVPFVSGDGNLLRFPGDPHGPGSDTIHCRCVVARQLKKAARTRGGTALPLAAG